MPCPYQKRQMIKLMEKISVRKEYYERYTQDLGLRRPECMYQLLSLLLGCYEQDFKPSA